MLGIVTGAYGMFGIHIAEGLLAAGIETLCVVRDEGKAKALMSRLQSKFPNVRSSYLLCDVSDHDEVRKLAASLEGTSVDILVNNAAITPKTRCETKKGIEQMWACNVLGYHWMMKELESHLLGSAHPPARVVNVASAYAGGLDFDDVEFKKRPFNNDAAYKASKQANRMLTQAWSRRWPADKIVAFSCHPGVATSGVSLGLGFEFDKSEAAGRAGAATPLHLCLDSTVLANSGSYFRDRKKASCPFSSDSASVNKLFEIAESYP